MLGPYLQSYLNCSYTVDIEGQVIFNRASYIYDFCSNTVDE